VVRIDCLIAHGGKSPPQLERKEGGKLKKALYGLKQSPRAWFGRFAKVMIVVCYKQSQGATLYLLNTQIQRE